MEKSQIQVMNPNEKNHTFIYLFSFVAETKKLAGFPFPSSNW